MNCAKMGSGGMVCIGMMCCSGVCHNGMVYIGIASLCTRKVCRGLLCVAVSEWGQVMGVMIRQMLGGFAGGTAGTGGGVGVSRAIDTPVAPRILHVGSRKKNASC